MNAVMYCGRGFNETVVGMAHSETLPWSTSLYCNPTWPYLTVSGLEMVLEEASIAQVMHFVTVCRDPHDH